MYLLSEKKTLFILKICGVLAMLALLVACSDSNNTSAVTPTVQSGTVAANTPGSGPTVISVVTVEPTGTTAVTGNTATSTPQGNPQKQVITLADRTLTIGKVSEQPGTGVYTTGIGLTITVTNTSHSPIMNQATFYQLEGAEGDSFGTQSSVSASFYGAIPAQGNRQGTIVFQVPTAAIKGIQLLYRPEVATETTLIPLGL
jgi:hypothetical protein